MDGSCRAARLLRSETGMTGMRGIAWLTIVRRSNRIRRRASRCLEPKTTPFGVAGAMQRSHSARRARRRRGRPCSGSARSLRRRRRRRRRRWLHIRVHMRVYVRARAIGARMLGFLPRRSDMSERKRKSGTERERARRRKGGRGRGEVCLLL